MLGDVLWDCYCRPSITSGEASVLPSSQIPLILQTFPLAKTETDRRNRHKPKDETHAVHGTPEGRRKSHSINPSKCEGSGSILPPSQTPLTTHPLAKTEKDRKKSHNPKDGTPPVYGTPEGRPRPVSACLVWIEGGWAYGYTTN